jgi:[ribosomal protein S18]-alanine N-acetyltransferase
MALSWRVVARRSRFAFSRRPQAVVVVRRYDPADLQGLHDVELACFPPHERYPKFFFAQANEIMRPGLAVAATDSGAIVGYLLCSTQTVEPPTGWVVSLAVVPAYRGKAVGRALLRYGEDLLREAGCAVALLSVDPQNGPALGLYRAEGWVEGRFEPHYFGPHEKRIIMAKDTALVRAVSDRNSGPRAEDAATLAEIAETRDLPSRLDESISSLTFVGLLFTVNFAVLAIGLKTLRQMPVVAVPLFVSLIACFYAAIAYAVVAGEVRAIKPQNAARAILQGNVLSEWFGVYPLIVAFVPLIWQMTHSRPLTIAALAANVAGYAMYALSDLSLLSRFATGVKRWIADGGVTVIVIVGGVASVVGQRVLEAVAILVGLAYCAVLSVWHARSREKDYFADEFVRQMR